MKNGQLSIAISNQTTPPPRETKQTALRKFLLKPEAGGRGCPFSYLFIALPGRLIFHDGLIAQPIDNEDLVMKTVLDSLQATGSEIERAVAIRLAADIVGTGARL